MNISMKYSITKIYLECRFPPPSDVNFLPTNEIMRRFNAQVEAGIIKPIKDADTKEIKIITFFETV